MAYSQEIFLEATNRLSERRQSAIRNAEYTREQLFQEIPRLQEIDFELQSIGASIAKSVIKAPTSAQESIEQLSERSISLQEEQDRILEEHHIRKNVFEPRYHCEKCKDTGYIEHDNRTDICECLTKLMSDIAGERLSDNLSLKDYTFDSFDLKYYSQSPDSEGRIPFNRMSKIYRYCVDYADHFTPRSKSLLFMGATGLGKTHLSLAIANAVIRKGMSVIYTTAPDILFKLEKEHFSYKYTDQEDTYQSLLKCDLLVLDDLGTEFSTEFTRSTVYNLFNSRLMAGKPMIISTNMTIDEMINAYSQRFFSRVIGSCDRLDFIGEDVRQLKNT